MKTLANLVIALLVVLQCAAQTQHTVLPGQTLQSIADSCGITVEELIAANPNSGSLFYGGMKLNIPQHGAVVETADPVSTSDKDHYRRSSLCIILLAHTGKKYAENMARVFENFPMPARYNEHNVSVRVVNVDGEQDRQSVEDMLRRKKISNQLVGRWFNRRSWDGRMDMELIHDRGGYGAFHDDYTRALSTVRGTQLLREEGVELIESTFVLVCDMDYFDRSRNYQRGASWAKLGSELLKAIGQYSQYQAQDAYNRGNYNQAMSHMQNAQLINSGASIADAGSAVLNDLGGFSVKIHAYLYKLRWDDNMTYRMFDSYWVDENTPRTEAERRYRAFENAGFGLEYIGDYKAKSGETHFRSTTDEDEVILEVCEKTVKKGIDDLARRFEVFRPRTPFYFQGTSMYAHIGTKEDVTRGQKFEIVQRRRDKKGRVKYKRVGEAQAVSPWNNTGIRFDEYFNDEYPGTLFEVRKGKIEELAATPGLQIREMH